jgi:hypothetical protein
VFGGIHRIVAMNTDVVILTYISASRSQDADLPVLLTYHG